MNNNIYCVFFLQVFKKIKFRDYMGTFILLGVYIRFGIRKKPVK